MNTDRIFLVEYLEQYFDEIGPLEFYREIFPEGELEKAGEQIEGRYNAVALELLPKAGENRANVRRYIVNDDLKQLEQLQASENFTIIAPVSYAGKDRTSRNARFIYALAFDLDGVEELHNIRDLFYQIDNQVLPQPTFTVWSGSGLHLYYQFVNPVPCFRNIVVQMQKLKRELTRKIWNRYISSLYESPQIESLFQGFRMVGGVTKGGNRTRAFWTGKSVSVEYLNGFVGPEFQVTQYAYKSRLTLKEAAGKYPEWYQKRVVEKQPRGTWTANRAVYEWWLERIRREASTGHRYYCLMVLAVYAAKCGIDREELERDAFGLVEPLDRLSTEESNRFTRADVLAALEMYNADYKLFPIDSITKLTAIHIEKNRRNGRKQAEHVKLMNFIRDEINRNTDWRNKEGRPSKQKQVEQWQHEHPEGTPRQCIDDTGISKNTVYKHWKKAENSGQKP